MSQTQNVKNKYLKTSIMDFSIGKRASGSYLETVHFSTPLKLAKPLLDDDDLLNLCILNASPGLFSGDDYRMSFHVKAGATVKLTAQSYTFLHNMESGRAAMDTSITLQEGATFIYMPQPVIPFEGSRFSNAMTVHAAPTSRFILTDIFSSGRKHKGESFLFDRYDSDTSVYEGGRLVMKDRSVIEPKKQPLLELGLYEGFSVQASVFFKGYEFETIMSQMRQAFPEDDSVQWGLSTLHVSDHHVLRILGNSAEYIREKLTDTVRHIYLGEKR